LNVSAMKLTVVLFVVLAVACGGCSRRDPSRVALSLAMRDCRLETAREIKHRDGGLREQVDELFFRVEPGELKAILPKAGFARDDSVPAQIRRSSTVFKEWIAGEDREDAIGFRRTDLGVKEGRYCSLLCAPDFSWAYLIYVDCGKS
jgi:hypothetical protein